MVPCVCTLDFLIAVSSTTLNSKGAIESPRRKRLLTLNSEGKYLPILTLAYISLFKIQNNLNNFGGKASVCVSLHISFLHTVFYAA